MTTAPAKPFAGRSVFVTGHTGFKGSWLAIWLSRAGARVTGYSLAPPTDPSNFAVSGVADLLSAHHQADLRDAPRLAAALGAADPEIVFHLAAQSLVRESYRSPRETFEVNTIGTAAVMDAVLARGKPCVVVLITSDKCYENLEQEDGYREEDRLGGRDPYSASKGAAEILIASYRGAFCPPERLAEHGIKVASTRAGNVIGGGDWAADRIVTDMVRALSGGEPVRVRNPRAVRPWQHVLEPLSGYLTLAARMLASDDPVWCAPWNFGPRAEAAVAVATLADLFIEAWGSGSWIDGYDPGQVHEAGILRLAIDKARNRLGWRPLWGLPETVRRTADWYRRYAEHGGEMLSACEADIAAYEQGEAAGT